MTIADLHNRERGAVLICASGPSIIQHPLKDAPVPIITMNKLWQLVWPAYHVALHIEHFEQDTQIYNALARENKLVVAGDSWPIGIKMGFWPTSEPKFSRDLILGVIEGWGSGGSVAYVALQLAVWLGFRDIYFAGLDLKGKHKFNGEPVGDLQGQQKLFKEAARVLDKLVDVKVIGKDSACEAFPKVDWPW